MKKILSLLCMVLLVVSCAKDTEYGGTGTEGAMRFSMALQADEVSADQNIVIKIYAKVGEELNLVRRYTSLADVPEKLSLLAGDYVAKVEVGEEVAASFDATDKYYYGEQPFTIKAGLVEPVAVECKLQNTMVAVEYDYTVDATFEDGYTTTVAIAEEYVEKDIKSGKTPALVFAESKTGYMLLPEGQTTLVWQFEGINPKEVGSELPDGSVTADGKLIFTGEIKSVKAGARYTIKLKYSPDAPGALGGFTAVVDEIVTEYQDNISFSPDPTIVPDGVNVDEVQSAIGANHVYKISALAPINKISIISDGEEFNVPLTPSTSAYKFNSTPIVGVTAVRTDDKGCNYDLTITEEFFVNVPGGVSPVTIYVEDRDSGHKSIEVSYLNQGVMLLDPSDFTAGWNNTIVFQAEVLDPMAADVKIAYRKLGDEAWSYAAATKQGDSNIYRTAAVSVANPETEYEYMLMFGDVQKGKIVSDTTPAGAQLPNAGFEEWGTQDGYIVPYLTGTDPFWLTGNEGAKMASAVLTQSSTDTRPGSKGRTSAYLKSQKAAVMGIGKFAAGNLFTGTFSLSGMDGTVTFGRDFAFNGKPKSLSFWMKHNEGVIDNGSQASGNDLCTVMFIITDGSTYAVNTKDSSTFFTMDDLATMKGVIAYGYYQTRESNNEWTEYTVDVIYREDMKDVTPQKIVVSFTPSGYGDYFCGSTQSWMYVDDIKLNY